MTGGKIWEKKRKTERRGEERRRERGREKRTGEKESTQPRITSLTNLIKLHFFPINNVLNVIITISMLYKRGIIQ